MNYDIEAFLDRYFRWLRSQTTSQAFDEWCEITTPFLDHFNDHLQIYIRESESGFMLTDDGYILQSLELSGTSLDTPKRQELLQTTVNGFGVQLEDGQLCATATADNAPFKTHALLQAMLAVDDLFYTAQPHVASIFVEDVARWLEERDIRFTPRIKLTGKSGYDHWFDFVIPKSKKGPERIVNAMANATRNNVSNVLMAWTDTRDVRAEDSRMYVVINNASGYRAEVESETSISASALEALTVYGVRPILWTKRDEALGELAA